MLKSLDPPNEDQALTYEVLGTWWSRFIPGFLSGLAVKYFVKKSQAKMRRINRLLDIEKKNRITDPGNWVD